MEHSFKKFVFERAINGAVAREEIFVQGNFFFFSEELEYFMLMENWGSRMDWR